MTIYLLDKTLKIDIFYECADQDLEDNICVSIVEECPPQERVMRNGETHLFLTADQAQQLGQALLAAAEHSQAHSTHGGSWTHAAGTNHTIHPGSTAMISAPGFTLCFLLHGDEVLMLHRRFPPNQGLWNGVGGHIEPGETPRQAVIREVAEETGYQINDPQFAGLLTWEGFEIPPGGIAIFTANVPHKAFVTNHEGDLAWQPRTWACTSPDVVDNIHVFLPQVLAGGAPQHYHFRYQDGQRVEDIIAPLPADFDPERPYQPADGYWEEQRGGYLLSFDQERLQLDVVEDFLAKRSYWAQNRPRTKIETSFQHSVCVGIYHRGLQVAFARLVTDQSTFAWLCDVFVDDDHRGQGLGKWLVEAVCRYTDRRGIDKILLVTRDAHRLYTDYGGFRPLDDPEGWLNRYHPDRD